MRNLIESSRTSQKGAASVEGFVIRTRRVSVAALCQNLRDIFRNVDTPSDITRQRSAFLLSCFAAPKAALAEATITKIGREKIGKMLPLWQSQNLA